MFIPESWGTTRRCRLGLKMEMAHETITKTDAPLYTNTPKYDGWASVIIHISGDVTVSNPYLAHDMDTLDIFTVTPMEVYSINWGHISTYERYILYFDPDAFDGVYTGNDACAKAIMEFLDHKNFPAVIKLSAQYQDLLVNILNEMEPLLGYNSIQTQITMLGCIIKLFDLVYKASHTQLPKTTPIFGNISDSTTQYINQHFKEISSVSDVAKALHVSPDYISKRYKKDTGVSIKDYLLDQKLSYSRHLISLGQTVTEAAISAGFVNISYFIQIYKKKYGTTPGKK